ncbi:restriction endonuclease subunit S [Streptomyces avermitilis]|uniref:restriction endonuclease subunit S n=1 Tax=Streptomyces avermitilis TaxID=33903 RepID=UPI0033ADC2FA
MRSGVKVLESPWPLVPLKQVVDQNRPVTYGVVQPGERQHSGVPIIRGKDYSSGSIDREDLYLIHPSVATAYARSTVEPGDILLSIVGYVGQTAEVPAELSGANITQTTARIAVRSEHSSRFFLHQLRSSQVQTQIQRLVKGSAQPGLNLSDVEKIPLKVPSGAVQRRIAYIIDAIDGQIAKSRAAFAKFLVVRDALIEERLSEIYATTPTVTLEEVAAVDRGRFAARPRNDPAYYDGKYWFIQTGDVASSSGGVIELASQTLNERGLATSREFPAGTVAVTIAANIGETAILGKPMCFPDSVVGVVAYDGYEPRFLELCLRRAKPRLEARAPQSAQKNINLQDLRPLRVPDASVEVQRQLAELWDICEAQRQQMTRGITKLQTLKQSIADDLLSGRVRVPTGSEG